MVYTETKTGVKTERAIPIEELSLRKAIQGYCTLLGHDDHANVLFYQVSRTLRRRYRKDRDEYLMGVELVAQHFSDSVGRMRRNMIVVEGHKPRETVQSDYEYFIDEAMRGIRRALEERHHKALSSALRS